MRLIRLFILIISSTSLISCGGSQSSDNQDDNKTFEDLGDQAEFREKHDEPRNIEDKDFHGEMLEIPIEGGSDGRAYSITNPDSKDYLLIFHEWWGLNEYIKQEADKWHQKLDKANIIAIDLYDGKVADKREKAKEYMQSVKEERLMTIINAAMKMIPENAEIGTLGWCFGGGWSLKAALAAGDRAEACVMFYGMPILDAEKLKGLNSDVLFIYGKKDEWINEEKANQFAESMKKAGKEVDIVGFEADHAFANPSQESYNEEAAMKATGIATEYLKTKLLVGEENLIQHGTDPDDYENEAEHADGSKNI